MILVNALDLPIVKIDEFYVLNRKEKPCDECDSQQLLYFPLTFFFSVHSLGWKKKSKIIGVLLVLF